MKRRGGSTPPGHTKAELPAFSRRPVRAGVQQPEVPAHQATRKSWAGTERRGQPTPLGGYTLAMLHLGLKLNWSSTGFAHRR